MKPLPILAQGRKTQGDRPVLEALNTEIDRIGNFLISTRQSAAAIRLGESPGLRLLYDVYRMQIMEGDLVANIGAYADRIGYVHIADVPGWAEPGPGEINFPWVFLALAKKDYYGLGFELCPSRNSLDMAKDHAELLTRV